MTMADLRAIEGQDSSAASAVEGVCLVCEGRAFDVVAEEMRDSDNHRVVRCDRCGMIQLCPLPSARDHEIFHREDRQSRGVGRDADAIAIAHRKASDTARRAAWISRRLAPGAMVLDVGSGYGTLLGALAQQGYRMLGLELSKIRTEVSQQLNSGPMLEGVLYRVP